MNKSAMHGESGYARIEGDAYFTPPWVTEELLKLYDFPEHIWEPAAGNGAMVGVLEAKGHNVLASDIEPQAEGIVQKDFLECQASISAAIITNPPYSHAQQFIEHSLELMKPCEGVVAMLLRNEYDCAKKRRHIFSDHPAFAMKLVLTKRPKWFADDKASPRHNFAWYVWDWKNEDPPKIRWQK